MPSDINLRLLGADSTGGLSRVLIGAASPRRREILRIVWHEERTAGDIHREMPDVTFGAVSLQLKVLLKAGLVETRAERRFHYYRARREAFGPVGEMLERMWSDALSRLKLAAELEESRRGPRPRSARATLENRKERIP
jgi:DNA-binding transcriptional ArsR family regulator